MSKKLLLCTDTGRHHRMARRASGLYSSTGLRATKSVAWAFSPMQDNFREVYMCSSVRSTQNHSGFISVCVGMDNWHLSLYVYVSVCAVHMCEHTCGSKRTHSAVILL